VPFKKFFLPLAFEESIDGCSCERLYILALMQPKNNDRSRNFFPLLPLVVYPDVYKSIDGCACELERLYILHGVNKSIYVGA